MEYNSGNNRGSDFKSAERVIVSITKCEKLSKSTVEKRQSNSKENISEQKSLDQLTSSMFVFNLHLSICSRKKFSLILIG